MSIAAIGLPVAPAPLAASGLRAEASAATTFLEMLESELVQEAVPDTLPPPTLPVPLPGQMPPEYPWLPLPLMVLPREDRTAKKRPPARKDRQSGRR